eukprot:TRINITY_DN4774_c4_g1_i1.p1 TRINITY_DN4774_c4_g1~~TRINITY_DN4774_c4_g1_i1.p1  ORF type:complete len:755 (+),score=230.14 TRINITY_DN4774_c4_g1_i1:76-2265(+)
MARRAWRLLACAAAAGAVLTPDCQQGDGLVLSASGTPTTAADGRVEAPLLAYCGGNPVRLSSAVAINGRCGDAGYQLYDGGAPVSADEGRWCLVSVPTSITAAGANAGATPSGAAGSPAQALSVLVMVLLDTSNSVSSSPTALADLRAAVTTFTDSVIASAPQALVAVHAFDGRSGTQRVVDPDWTGSQAAVSTGLAGLTCDASSSFCRDPSSTNLYGALDEASRLLKLAAEGRSVAANYLIFFTDGTDQSRRLSRQQAVASIASVPGIEVHAVGVMGETTAGTSGVDTQELTVLAQGRADRVYTTQSFSDLSTPFSSVAQSVGAAAAASQAGAAGYYRIEYCTPRRSGDRNSLRLRYNGLDLGWAATYDATGIDSEAARACETSVCVCTPAPPVPPPSPPPPAPAPPPVVCLPVGCVHPDEVARQVAEAARAPSGIHRYRRAAALRGSYSDIEGRETQFLAECTARLQVAGAVCADVMPGSIVVVLGSNSSDSIQQAHGKVVQGGISAPSFGSYRLENQTLPTDCDDDAVWHWRYIAIGLAAMAALLCVVVLLLVFLRCDKSGGARAPPPTEPAAPPQGRPMGSPHAYSDAQYSQAEQQLSQQYAPASAQAQSVPAQPESWRAGPSSGQLQPSGGIMPGALVYVGPAWETRRHVEACAPLRSVPWNDVYEDHCQAHGTVEEVDDDGTVKVVFPDRAEVWYPIGCLAPAQPPAAEGYPYKSPPQGSMHG